MDRGKARGLLSQISEGSGEGMGGERGGQTGRLTGANEPTLQLLWNTITNAVLFVSADLPATLIRALPIA